MDNTTRARLQFLTWLKKTSPGLYAEAVARANQSRLGEDSKAPTESWWQKMVTGVAAVGTTYLSLKNQRDAMKINIQRAQAGQPPIDMADSAPVVRTQIELPPDIITKVTQSAGDNINKMLVFGGLGLAAVLLLTKK